MDNSKLRFVALVIVGLVGLAVVGAGLARCDAEGAAPPADAADAGEPAFGATSNDTITSESTTVAPAEATITAPAAAEAPAVVAPAVQAAPAAQ